ncbi:MAG: carbon storage regulator [Planctomycetes bacterium]|nr:carbon storage regulator [Planctomycetota bacterium]
MLVLTRGLKQQILIDGGLVTVTVLEINGSRVRLGIEAPHEVSVRRKELADNPQPVEVLTAVQ